MKILSTVPVSYTHLDVYKRQVEHSPFLALREKNKKRRKKREKRKTKEVNKKTIN